MILKTHKGYSLLEIMIGMAIVAGILVGIIQMAKTITTRMKATKTKSILAAVKIGVENFKVDISRYPTKLDEIINPPADADEKRIWQGPYVDEGYFKAAGGILKDDYGNELEYLYDNAKNSYTLYSWGPKGAGADTGHIYAE